MDLLRNSAASPVGSSRGVKRAPVGYGSPTRSTRNVRQSSRSRSYATRYQRHPVLTRRYGSTCRRVSAPSPARYANRSRSRPVTADAITVSVCGSIVEPSPRVSGIVAFCRVETRWRSREGSTCSSLARARTEASSTPSMAWPTPARSPTAMATASSSSSSSGGIAAPATRR